MDSAAPRGAVTSLVDMRSEVNNVSDEVYRSVFPSHSQCRLKRIPKVLALLYDNRIFKTTSRTLLLRGFGLFFILRPLPPSDAHISSCDNP